ncbi:hypothetical protein [Brachyspira aalborgi]|uniref:hypothetical protein n=1 Tax=Brachyspira aalborgi TaxID=29522 RepID=UPI00266B89A5|nr:hypothetical protein [Brachyspira aalborgi]
MKNSKKLFLIFLSVLIVAFVSCKKDSGGSITTPTPTFKPSSLVGEWTATKNTAKNQLKIEEASGKVTAKVDNTDISFTIDNWDTDKDKEVQEYTLTHKITKAESTSAENWTITYTFKNSDSCASVYSKNTGEAVDSGSDTFVKKAAAATAK